MLKRCVCVTSSITRSAGWVVLVVVLVGWRKVVQTESKMPLNFIPFLNLVFLRIKCLPLPVSCLVNSSFFPSSSETTFSLAVLADTGREKKNKRDIKKQSSEKHNWTDSSNHNNNNKMGKAVAR